MKIYEVLTEDIFNVQKTGRSKYDDMIANPAKYPRITTKIKTMSPDAAMSAMAKGQNKSLKQILDRRMKMGAEEKVKKIAAICKDCSKKRWTARPRCRRLMWWRAARGWSRRSCHGNSERRAGGDRADRTLCD